MKKWLRNLCKPCSSLLIAVLVAFSVLIYGSEPEACALCAEHDSVWSCPYVVNLETGDVGQLAMHDVVPGEMERAVSDSYLFFVTDLLAENKTDAQGSTTSVMLPEAAACINPDLFCPDCRAKIEAQCMDTEGYVLADLSDPENIQIYPITDGAEYELCGYTVTITQSKRDKGLTITVSK